jgi:hypothetical protein
MRRIQIYIDEPLDEVLQEEARRRGVSKAALIRNAVAREYPPPAVMSNEDGLALLDGIFDGGEPDVDIDEVVYGRKG